MPVVYPPPARERRNVAARAAVLLRIRAEFHEMPCLRLTPAQAQRLFALRADICERVFAALVAEGTLARGADGRYGARRDTARTSAAPRPVAAAGVW